MLSGVARDILIAFLFLAVFATLPFVLDGRYYTGQIVTIFFYAVVASQWNLVFGVAGIFSLAQMALFAFGAYATAMLGFYLDWSVWAAMPLAGLTTVLVSILIGLACLRLTGAYVALLTLSIAQVVYFLIVTDTDCFVMEGVRCRQFTGGAVGFSQFGDLGTRKAFRGDWLTANYFIVLALLIVSMLFTYVIVKSPMGLAFRALRDNPGYAISRGIGRFKYQLLVFGLSAFFTGIAGGLWASHFRAIGPNLLSLSLMLFVLATMVVGGVGRFWGPLVGAILLVGADEVMREFGEYRTLGLGLILAVFVVAMPQGIVGLLKAGAACLRRRLKETAG
ncbi:MAG: branched-chain amino acid ABC transporter permease [Rhodospirillales bacterium]|nr:branched-chain amino acid ABC transporter permease [Rhodospirillales bacterium]